MSNQPSPRPLLSALLLASVLAGCASTYDTGYVFQPRPREASVRGPGGQAGRVSATVLGVREEGPDGRAEIDVKVRVERYGETPVSVVPDELRLVTGDRETLVVRDVRTLGPAIAASGGAAVLQAAFPLPGRDPSKFDLSGLDLVVAVDVGERRETVHLPFQRGATEFLWIDPWGWPGPDYNGNPTGWRK
jgi:hypothetical protein